MLTLSVPEGTSLSSRMPAMAASSEASGSCTCARKRSPLPVSASRRVLRWNSRTPTWASRCATFLLTAAADTPRLRAAAEKLPCSAARTKDVSRDRSAMPRS